jgi:hypothetical protein
MFAAYLANVSTQLWLQVVCDVSACLDWRLFESRRSGSKNLMPIGGDRP